MRIKTKQTVMPVITFTASSRLAPLCALVLVPFRMHSGSAVASACRSACHDHGHERDCTPRDDHPHRGRCHSVLCPGAFFLRNLIRSLKKKSRSWTRRLIRPRLSACDRCSILFATTLDKPAKGKVSDSWAYLWSSSGRGPHYPPRPLPTVPTVRWHCAYREDAVSSERDQERSVT
jgi:hypothetical protein